MGDVVAMGAHHRSAPHHHAHHLGVGPFLLEVLVQQGLGQLLAHLPGGGGGDGVGVHRVEVAAGGQDVGHTPGGRAAGPRWDKLALQAPQQVVDFVGGPQQGRVDGLGRIAQHPLRGGVGPAQHLSHHLGDLLRPEALGQQLGIGAAAQGLQSLHHVAPGANRRIRVQVGQEGGYGTIHRLAQVGQQPIVVQA